MYVIYFLVNESKDKTYIGFTNDISKRIKMHFSGNVRTTENFGKFEYFILERVDNLEEAIKKERYWKSCAGRKKVKEFYGAIV